MVSDKTFRALAEEPANVEAAGELNGLQVRRRLGLLQGVVEECKVSRHPDTSLAEEAYTAPARTGGRRPRRGGPDPPASRRRRVGLADLPLLPRRGVERPARLGAITVAAAVASGATRRVRVLLDDDGGLMCCPVSGG